MDSVRYVIRGGVEGRERLRLLSEVMGPSTRALLAEVGIPPGSTCLDVGCGGGDVTFELARAVGPSGRVLGVDRDQTKLDIATREAGEMGLSNVAFETRDVTAGSRANCSMSSTADSSLHTSPNPPRWSKPCAGTSGREGP